MTLITTPEVTRIIGCAMRVHTRLGPGVFESVYEECLAYELHRTGLAFKRPEELCVDVGENLRSLRSSVRSAPPCEIDTAHLLSFVSLPVATSTTYTSRV